MQHVGVADHYIAVQPDRLARVAGRVAVEGESAHAEVAGRVEFQQLGHLVLGERLGREQVERLLARGHHRRHHGQGEAKRLARGRRRGDHDVLAPGGRGPGLSLVRVELGHAARAQRNGQRRRQVVGQRYVAPFPPFQHEVAGNAVAVALDQSPGQFVAAQRQQSGIVFVRDGGRQRGAHGRSPGKPSHSTVPPSHGLRRAAGANNAVAHDGPNRLLASGHCLGSAIRHYGHVPHPRDAAAMDRGATTR